MICDRAFLIIFASLSLALLPAPARAFGNASQDAQKQKLVEQLRQESMENLAQELEKAPEESYIGSRPVFDQEVRTPQWDADPDEKPSSGKKAPSGGGSGGERTPRLSGSGKTS